MSTEQENFDDLLKSKLDENEFVFNEANWDKAEMLIIEAEKKRKRRIIGFIFFIGMLLGVCVMIPFINGKNDVEKMDLSNKKIDDKTVNEVKSENEIESNNKIIKTDTDKKFTQENGHITPLAENTSYKNLSEEVNQKKEETTNTNLYSSEKQKSNSTEAGFAETKKSRVTKTKDQKGRSGGNKNNDTPSIVKENGAEEVKMANSDKKKGETTKIEEIKHTTPAKNEKPNIVPSTTDSARVPELTNSNLKKDTIVVTKDSVAKTKVDSIKPVVKDETKIFKKTTLFSIDAGANYAFGWTNNTTREAAGFNAVFGISVTHQFIKKLGVLVGVQYNSLAHLSYSNYISNNLQYDLGYNQTKTVITPTILYYIAVPIKLHYYFNEKNSLSIGLNTLYLLNTSSKVETYTESTFGASVYNVSTKKGYMDGFSTWDLQPTLAYRRRIIKCLSVSVEMYYGLMDLKNNAAFGLTKSEHNSGMKLTLSYNLLHK
jgi:hypothetical protein